MGIINALNKLGCSHDWGYWQSYDGSFTNMVTAFASPKRLESCYEYRRCGKCTGIEARWDHRWYRVPETVTRQLEWERQHPNGQMSGGEGYFGPGIEVECSKCNKRGLEVLMLGD